MIRARVDPKLKKSAEAVFRKLGVRTTDAIAMFYAQVTLRQGIPFEVALPKHDDAPSAEGATWPLADVWRKLDELDRWRAFSRRLDGLTLS